jgi:uncharacterized protein
MADRAFMKAVEDGELDLVASLIDGGSDVNQTDGDHEWTALNYAAGKGNLQMVKLLVEKGADVFKRGRDMRTPYKIAIAASNVQVAKFLARCEEAAGGDVRRESSREWEVRPYCKAYKISDLQAYPNWSGREKEQVEKSGRGKNVGEDPLADVCFIHQDFTVTKSIWYNEDVFLSDITEEWKKFCEVNLNFRVPTDFDLVPSELAK